MVWGLVFCPVSSFSTFLRDHSSEKDFQACIYFVRKSTLYIVNYRVIFKFFSISLRKWGIAFIRDISELTIRCTSEIIDEKEVLSPQDFLDGMYINIWCRLCNNFYKTFLVLSKHKGIKVDKSWVARHYGVITRGHGHPSKIFFRI